MDVGIGNLWLLELKAKTETRLLEKVGRYTWSPDGANIVLINPAQAEGIDGLLQIYTLSTGQLTTLTKVDFLGSDYDPQWLPTDEIVFVRDGQLWSIGADGTNEHAMPNFPFVSMTRQSDVILHQDEPKALLGFHFSPDGKSIAYLTRHESMRAIARKLWIAEADGANPRLITGQAEGSYYSWSPDSTRLLFNTYRDLDDSFLDERLERWRGLWVVDGDGKHAQPVHRIEDWGAIIAPVWSPDGSKVAFIDFQRDDLDQATDIWITDVTGTGQTGPIVRETKAAIRLIWWWSDGASLLATQTAEDRIAPATLSTTLIHLATAPPPIVANQGEAAPPTPIPPPYPDLRVVRVEPVASGPYMIFTYSPDRRQALITKHLDPKGYVLARLKESLIDTALGDLWLLDVASGKETLLLERVGRYSWSLDGTRIAIVNPTEKEGIAGELLIYAIATGEQNVLTQADFLGAEYTPQWTADEKIIFVRDGQLWQIAADGTAEAPLPALRFRSRSREDHEKVFHQNDPLALNEFQLAPDGKHLAYRTFNDNIYAISSRLWVSQPDGSHPQLITNQAIGFVWSPNSEWLAIPSMSALDDPVLEEQLPPRSQLWVVHLADQKKIQLFQREGWGGVGKVSWSPDNSRLSFFRGFFTDKGAAGSLWIANVIPNQQIGPLLGNLSDSSDLAVAAQWNDRGNALFVMRMRSEDLAPGYYNELNYSTELFVLQQE